MESKEFDIEFPRGDTCPVSFQLIDENGDIIKLKDDDELYFTMKKSYNEKEYILQKKYSTGEIVQQDGKCVFTILSKDTNELNYGSYVYDLCFRSRDLTKTICIGQITITNEVTFIGNE